MNNADKSDNADSSTHGGSTTDRHHSAKNPACDLCREKKVKCGREKPGCKNCLLLVDAGVVCTYSERQKRDSESSRMTQRFDEINDRLDHLDSSLLRLTALLESQLHQQHQQLQQGAPAPLTPSRTSASHSLSPPPPPPASRSTASSTASSSSTGGTLLVPDIKGNIHYLGSSSLLSITTEAETLAKIKLSQCSSRQGPRKPEGTRGKISKIGGSSSSGGGGGGREIGRRKEQAEALKGLRGLSGNVVSLFPTYGHGEFRGAEGWWGGGMPEREVVEELVEEYFRKVNTWFPIFDETSFKQTVSQFYLEHAQALGNISLSSDKSGCPLLKDRGWIVCFNNVLLFGMYSRCPPPPPPPEGVREGAGPKKTVRPALVANAKRYYDNAWAALDDLETFLSPRLRNIQALLTGAVITIEISRPGLCWSLLSQAARLSQAIGLHRSTTTPSKHLFSKAEIEERKCVFWNVYIMDKCLSLTFGRSTCLPDFDIDVELPEYDPAAVGGGGISRNFMALIWLAKIQSSIYEQLYSASAGRKSEAEREKSIWSLDAELRAWWEEKKQLFDESNSGRRDMRAEDGKDLNKLDFFSLLELRFSYHSSLTLVHRMARPPTSVGGGGGGGAGQGDRNGESERICLDSARESIRMVTEAVELNTILANSGMIMWLFQYYPFTSFFILFTSIIRYPSSPSSKSIDYNLMKSLVSYLSKMQPQNEGAAKLLPIAEAFTHVAGTFLKNYRRVVATSAVSSGDQEGEENEGEEEVQRQRVGKKRRRSRGKNENPNPFERGAGGGRGNTFDLNSSTGCNKNFYPTVAFPGDEQARTERQFLDLPPHHHQHHQNSIPPSQHHHHHHTPLTSSNSASASASTASSAASSNSNSFDFLTDDFEAVDLQPTSFLKWPVVANYSSTPMATSTSTAAAVPQVSSNPPFPTTTIPQPQPSTPWPPQATAIDNIEPTDPTPGVYAAAPFGPVDFEMLLAEPEGFRMQIEAAAMRGPLEFDWFGWDGQFDL